MAKIIAATIFLVVLLIFNPGGDAHREALHQYIQKSFNTAYKESGFVGKIGLTLGGDAIKETIINSVYRKSYGILSLGYIDDKIVSLGFLGYVHVFE